MMVPPDVLRKMRGIEVIRHPHNRGYGAALKTAFEAALSQGYQALVTIDCDGQHEPRLIPELVRALQLETVTPFDLVSGSRYLQPWDPAQPPPADRQQINREITAWLNRHFGFGITDAFCGFKAYRVGSLAELEITEPGYAMPLQLWVQAARLGWRIVEYPVPLIYLDASRSFGGSLDDAQRRLLHYYEVLHREIARQRFPCETLPLERHVVPSVRSGRRDRLPTTGH
ncbi:MAG: hypothetical protein KatS3mg114_0702 [Planctomycetaceae bacterium]|nr:MAG: hypothetical protein KatS3mg114_0702 [Planctomycetaceae bacterium]